MSGRLGVLLAICCGVWSSPVASQSAKIRITVAVADSVTGGLLTSAAGVSSGVRVRAARRMSAARGAPARLCLALRATI